MNYYFLLKKILNTVIFILHTHERTQMNIVFLLFYLPLALYNPIISSRLKRSEKCFPGRVLCAKILNGKQLQYFHYIFPFLIRVIVTATPEGFEFTSDHVAYFACFQTKFNVVEYTRAQRQEMLIPVKLRQVNQDKLTQRMLIVSAEISV